VFTASADAGTPADIMARVCAVIARVQGLPVGQVHADSTFAELGIESLDAVNLLFALEDAFGITIPAEDENYVTVRQAVEGVMRHLEAKACR